jgi:hypothetical protein
MRRVNVATERSFGTCSQTCLSITTYVHIGGYSRGRAKTRVALRDELPVSLRHWLAEFTAAD